MAENQVGAARLFEESEWAEGRQTQTSGHNRASGQFEPSPAVPERPVFSASSSPMASAANVRFLANAAQVRRLGFDLVFRAVGERVAAWSGARSMGRASFAGVTPGRPQNSR
jgi:threonine dehydrogenase-like Zn-dependent dehydrogenase